MFTSATSAATRCLMKRVAGTETGSLKSINNIYSQRSASCYYLKQEVFQSKRYYGSGHHHDDHHEAPKKPYKPTLLRAELTQDADPRKVIPEAEGWLFGKRVAYVDHLKPLPVVEGNGRLWNRKPLPDGKSYPWDDWEAISYIGTGICVLIFVIMMATQPDHSMRTWAHEEMVERRILRKRRELAESQADSL